MDILVYAVAVFIGFEKLYAGLKIIFTGTHSYKDRKFFFSRAVLKTEMGTHTYPIGAAYSAAGIILLVASFMMIVSQNNNVFGFVLLIGLIVTGIQIAGYFLSKMLYSFSNDEPENISR